MKCGQVNLVSRVCGKKFNWKCQEKKKTSSRKKCDSFLFHIIMLRKIDF